MNFDSNGEPVSITVAATFTADSLEIPLRFWMKQLGHAATIQFFPYGQLFQQLLSFVGGARDSAPLINVHLIRLEDWGGGSSDSAAPVGSALERNVDDYLRRLRAAAEEPRATFIVCICPSSEQVATDSRANALIEKMASTLAAEAEKISAVHVLRHQDVTRLYPVAEACDAYTDRLAHVPYTPVFFTALGSMIARKIHALRKLPHKVLVLDCDNTLWTGVCAEDGPAGVQIDDQRKALQQFLLDQRAAGMILCLCSKNNEEDVQAVFDTHPEMLLQREHFLASRINWTPKSENLRSLADQLNLGLDSFVLIDDDAVECAEVKANCSDVLSIRLPDPTVPLAKFLEHLWIFDRGKVTEEDQRRSEMYRENFQRESVRQRSFTWAEFLAELELKVEIAPAEPESLGRISDLTYRTNQFNLSTARRSESELSALQRRALETLAIRLRDRFGDYGLVGAVIFEICAQALVVDTLLLSCRALGRGVEHRILAHLGNLAADRGADRVELRFVPTSKNKPAHDFLESLAGAQKFADAGGLRYQLSAAAARECRLDHSGPMPANGREPTVAEFSNVEADGGRSKAQFRDDFLLRVAVELNDARAIHEAITSFERTRPQSAAPVVPPGTVTEGRIAEVWSELLGFDRIGVHDDFFNLGGNSLVAMQVLSRIRTIFNVELSPRLFVTEAFTVATLSKAVLVEQIQQANATEVEALVAKLEDLSLEQLGLAESGEKK